MCSYNVLRYCNVGIDSLHFWLSGALWVWAKSICYFPSLNTQTHLLTHIRKAPYKRSPSWTDTCTCTHSLQLQFVPICSRRWGGGQSDTDGWTAAWTESKDNKWREGRNELTVKCIHYSYRNKCLVRNWWHHHQSASHALLFPSHRWALAGPCISLRCSYICSNFVAFIFIVYVSHRLPVTVETVNLIVSQASCPRLQMSGCFSFFHLHWPLCCLTVLVIIHDQDNNFLVFH